MTKRELTKWLFEKKDHAIRENKKIYDEARRKLLDERFQELGFDKVADQIQAHLDEALGLWDTWKNGLPADSGIRCCGSYYSLEHSLNGFTHEPGAAYESLTGKEMRLETDALTNLNKESQQIHENICKTYADVLAVVSSLKTVKEAQAYLKELGFDLTELEKEQQPVTALAVKIDASYLFLDKAA